MNNWREQQTKDILSEWDADKSSVIDKQGNIDRPAFRCKIYRLADLNCAAFRSKFDEVLDDLVDEIQARINPNKYHKDYYSGVLRKVEQLKERGIMPLTPVKEQTK